MLSIIKTNMSGLSAILFSLTLACNIAQACCPTNNPNTTATDISSETAGDPIGLIDGKVLLEEKDLVLQTPILGLEFIRSWKTPGNSSSVLRGGWEHSYEWKVDDLNMHYIPEATNTYQGIFGEYVVVKIPVNPYDGAYKGGNYHFVRGANNTGLTNVSNVYSCVGRELRGAKLYKMTDGTWELSNLSGNGVRYLFDTGGDLTQIVHPSSTSITLSYDNYKKLTNIAHSCGTSLSLTYSGNYLTQVRNNRDTNLWMQYSYGATSGIYNKLFTATRHVSSSSSDNQVFQYYYKSLTNMNNVSRFVIARKVTPVGNEYLWNYLTDGSLMADRAWIVAGGITNNYGTTLLRTPNEYNTRMNVEVQTDGLNNTTNSTTYRYDLIRMVPTRITGPLPSQTERRAYNDDKDLTRQYFVLGTETAINGRSYDTNRNIIGLYSAYGIDTSSYEADKEDYLDYSLTWTANRHLSSIRDIFGRGYQFQYNSSQDNPIQISAVDENNNIRTLANFSYTSEGLPIYYGNANNHITAFTSLSDSSGRTIIVQPPLGYPKTMAFDHLWRPTSFSEYDSDGIQRTTYFQTDYAGRLLTITNPSNQVTSFQYDKAGRLIYAEDPSGYYVTNQWRLGKLVSQTTGKTGSSVSANISLEYDPQMTMVSVKDPKNRYVETYGLDAAGQITTVTNLEGQTMEITRGVLGMVTDIKRFDNTYIFMTYTDKGLVSSVSYYDNDYYYNYFANGLLSSISGNNNYIELSYDNWNDLVQVQNIVASNEDGWFYITNNYAYDVEGNLTNKVLTMFNSTNNYAKTLISSSYLYDANERLIGENDTNGNPRWRYAYNSYSGKLAYATNMVSGIYCKYTYDALGRIQSMVYNKSTRGWIPYYIYYTYDDSGRIIMKDAFGGGQDGIGAASYTYDSLGNISYEHAFGVATNYYNYDLAGNRTSTYNVFGTTYFTPTNNNRLETWGSNGWMTYNDAGCVNYLTRNTKTNIINLELSWNGEYQLTQVIAVDSSDNYHYIYYTYDSLGRKISRKESDGNNWCKKEYYIYDGMNLVADYDAINGSVIRTYTYGPGVDDIQSMTTYEGNEGPKTYYYIKDASNTVHVLVDETGLIVEYYYYDAFGNVKMRDENYQWMTKSKCGNRFLFQGREYDYDTALYYFRNRWYEPETGRWLSPDPIGISGGLNLYAFCGNDPVNQIDPMGLWGIEVDGFLIGSGNPWLAFDASTLDTMWNGGAAVIDGMIPWFNPFDTLCDAYKNECGEYDSSYEDSYNIGVWVGTGIDLLLGYKYKWYPAVAAGINMKARFNDSHKKFKK